MLTGCARTVTTLPAAGNLLNIEITFRDNVDTTNNKYYLIFAGAAPQWPNVGPNTYFFAPGETYDPNRLNASTEASYYYTNYFSTWNDFIILKNDIFNITNGPFTNPSGAYTPSWLAVRDTSTANAKKIVLSFYLSKLSTLPSELYFNFICVDSNWVIKDYLHATDNKITTTIGTSIYNRIEPEDLSISGALDIRSWSMTVE